MERPTALKERLQSSGDRGEGGSTDSPAESGLLRRWEGSASLHTQPISQRFPISSSICQALGRKSCMKSRLTKISEEGQCSRLVDQPALKVGAAPVKTGEGPSGRGCV